MKIVHAVRGDLVRNICFKMKKCEKLYSPFSCIFVTVPNCSSSVSYLLFSLARFQASILANEVKITPEQRQCSVG